MQAIPIQQDNVTSLPADDFNPIPRELENFIQTSGQVLSGGDLNQVGKAAAVYAGGSDFYTDTGAADAYVLAAIGGKMLPPAYFLGLRVRFKIANTNTLAAVTVQLGALAAVPVSKIQVADLGTPLISVGDMPADEIVELVYDQTDDTLTDYWRMVSVSTSQKIGTRTFTQNPTLTKFEDSSDSSEMTLMAGKGGSEEALKYASGGSGREVYVKAQGVGVVEAAGASYTLETYNNGRGIVYVGGPWANAVSVRKVLYDASSMAWQKLGGGGPAEDRMWVSTSNVTLSGIPHSALSSFSFGVNLRWKDSNDEYNVPLSCQFVNNGGIWELTEAWFIGNTTWDPDTFSDEELIVTFDASDVD